MSGRRGGYDKIEWLARYRDRMQIAGMSPYEAECWALNAWEASDDPDEDPDQAAFDELSYLAEDGR